MFTRCPGCKTVHPLNAVLLAQGNGLYRCGHCNKVSNALQNLFDSWPESDDESSNAASTSSRQPPVLGDGSESVEAGNPIEVENHEVTEEEARLLRAAGFQNHPEPLQPQQKFWMIAAIVMAVVTLANIFYISGDALMAQPSIRAALEGVGVLKATSKDEYRNLDMLHLASSEMHSHPTLDETLILNATIVNRADLTQAFPSMQITLLDAQSQPLALRVFKPDEYLHNDYGPGDGIAPGAYLPVIMELLDPGQHAVGFEIKFL